MDNEIKRKIEILEMALGEYIKNQKVETTRCERCDELIEIEKLGMSAFSVKCKCGYHNDTLRGL